LRNREFRVSLTCRHHSHQLADSRRSGDEIHPWLPNGDLQPFAATRSVLVEGPHIR